MIHDKFCPLPLLGGLPDDTNCFVCEALLLKAADEREQAAQRVEAVEPPGYFVMRIAAFAAARGEDTNNG